MTRSRQKLDALAAMLERAGDDPVRLDLVHKAQAFKRSWVELAERLSRLQKSRSYEAWGYADLHEYCVKELSLKASTVDKLVLSYGALHRHAPEVLKRDGVARPIPTFEAVDYFSRALGDEGSRAGGRRLDAPREVLAELREAVFEQGSSVGELRQRFNPVLFPKPKAAEREALWRRTRDAAKRVIELVQQVEELSEARVARVQAILDALGRDLDKLIEDASGDADDDEGDDADEAKRKGSKTVKLRAVKTRADAARSS